MCFFSPQPSPIPLGSCCRQDSDSDWAPEVQGAANVEKSEEEALKVLLQPNFVKEKSPESLGNVLAMCLWRCVCAKVCFEAPLGLD